MTCATAAFPPVVKQSAIPAPAASPRVGAAIRSAVQEDLILGYSSGSSGTYDLRDGSLSAGRQTIGNSGTGSFTQRGGSNTISDGLTLGSSSDGSGSYALIDGSLSAESQTIGKSGTGSFTQSGGAIRSAVVFSAKVSLWVLPPTAAAAMP